MLSPNTLCITEPAWKVGLELRHGHLSVVFFPGRGPLPHFAPSSQPMPAPQGASTSWPEGQPASSSLGSQGGCPHCSRSCTWFWNMTFVQVLVSQLKFPFFHLLKLNQVTIIGKDAMPQGSVTCTFTFLPPTEHHALSKGEDTGLSHTCESPKDREIIKMEQTEL